MATVTSYTSAHIDSLLAAINASIASNTTALASKADLSGGVLTSAQVPTNLVRTDSLVLNVMDHGAIGDGVADDTTAIQNTLNLALSGDIVYLPKTHLVSAPIKIPPQVKLLGKHGSSAFSMTRPSLKAKSTFAGAAVILLVDQTTGAYSVTSNEQRIESVTIDCSALSGGSVDGIQAQGLVQGVYLKSVGIYHPTGYGINFVSNASGIASGWHSQNVTVASSTSAGINAAINNSTWTDCLVTGGASYGWLMSIGSAANSIFDACRSELNAASGFHIAASTGTGAASGGPIFTGCTTDRNAQHGVNITASAVGNAPISFIGCSFRRDGSSSTSSGYAGVNVAGSVPVILTGCQTHVGPDDAGTGNSTPQYGLAAASANVTINGGFWRGISEGVHDGGSNTKLSRGINLFEETGAVGSPTDTTRTVQTTGTNGTSLYVPGNLAGIATPASHGLLAWTADPACIQGGSSPGVGVRMMSAVYVPRSVSVTKIFWGTTASGLTPTTGQNWIGLYDSSGNRLGSAGIDSRVAMTPQMVSETISSVALSPGLYWVAWVFNASTVPSVMRSNNLLDATVINAFQTATNFRFCTNLNGQTTMAATLAPASNVASPWALWAALA